MANTDQNQVSCTRDVGKGSVERVIPNGYDITSKWDTLALGSKHGRSRRTKAIVVEEYLMDFSSTRSGNSGMAQRDAM